MGFSGYYWVLVVSGRVFPGFLIGSVKSYANEAIRPNEERTTMMQVLLSTSSGYSEARRQHSSIVASRRHGNVGFDFRRVESGLR